MRPVGDWPVALITMRVCRRLPAPRSCPDANHFAHSHSALETRFVHRSVCEMQRDSLRQGDVVHRCSHPSERRAGPSTSSTARITRAVRCRQVARIHRLGAARGIHR